MSKQQWRELIDQQRGSGLPVAAFCGRRGAAVSTFFTWRSRLRKPARSRFVELTTPEAQQADSSSGHVDVLLPGGLRVRVTTGFDARLLHALVEALS